MNIPLVDLKAQYSTIKDEIDPVVADVLGSCAFIGGKHVKSFEADFAAFCGTEYCVGVGNGTDALFIALKALGVGAGDEVITAANSFIATSEAITMTGARVVFADIDPVTYNIGVADLERKITGNTKAVVPVHLYGQPADMEPITALARKHGLKIVGDAAQAHGALYHGEKIATLVDATCYSFYPGKNLGAYGDGGAVVTDDGELADRVRMFANHGRADKYNHEFEGVNSRLDGLQAAILGVKLRHLDDWTEKRRAHASRYNWLLADAPVTTPAEIDNVRAVYHLYVIRVPREKRDALMGRLKENGVAAGIHYPIALPCLKAYEYLGHSENDFPHAVKASQEIVSLPMFPELTDEQVGYIVDKVKEAL